MAANLLTLNFSKTEFLLIGHKQQLTKIDYTSLSTIHHRVRKLGFILLHCPNLAILIFVNFVIRPHLHLKAAGIITNSIVHSKLDYCN